MICPLGQVLVVSGIHSHGLAASLGRDVQSVKHALDVLWVEEARGTAGVTAEAGAGRQGRGQVSGRNGFQAAHEKKGGKFVREASQIPIIV